MPTLTEILADIDTRYPNTFTDTQKVYWLNRSIQKYYKYAPVEKTMDVQLSTSPSYLATTDGFKFENLLRVEFYNTTNAIATSDREEYTLFEKAGTKESRANDHIYDSSGLLGFFPPPSTINGFEDKYIRVKFYKFPDTMSTTASTVSPDIDEKYQDILVHSVINIVAKSGINPDIDIANNAQADLEEVLKQARFERSRRRYQIHNKNKISYKEGWEAGSDIDFTASS